MRAAARDLGLQAQVFRDRLSAAFASAMTGQHEPGLASERGQFLTAATLGIWLTARIDPRQRCPGRRCHCRLRLQLAAGPVWAGQPMLNPARQPLSAA